MILLWAAVTLAIAGTCVRVLLWWSIPLRLPIPLSPAPRSRSGVVLRILAEVFLMRALWRGDRLGWLLSWSFHAALLLVAIGHWPFLTGRSLGWLAGLRVVGLWPGVVVLLALAALLGRRLLSPRIRFISTPADYLWLLLFLGATASGLALAVEHGEAWRSALVFLHAWRGFSTSEVPLSGGALLHLIAAVTLLGLFPFSKLLHAPAVFSSPTLVARDAERRRR